MKLIVFLLLIAVFVGCTKDPNKKQYLIEGQQNEVMYYNFKYQ